MGLGQLPAYGVWGLWLCTRHLTYLIFTQTQLKLVRLLPVPQSVYNRVTVQLCLIICQSRPLFNLARDNKSQKTRNFKLEVEHGFCFCLNVHIIKSNGGIGAKLQFELIACHSAITQPGSTMAIKRVAIYPHTKASIFCSLIVWLAACAPYP